MTDKDLIERLIGVIERNNTALDKVASAINSNAAKNENLAARMDKMTATITGAQRKIGGELGPVIDRSKAAAAAMEKETRRAVESRGQGRNG